MSGFGVAYDAAVRALVAQRRVADQHASRHLSRQQGWQQQMLAHVLQRDRKLDLLADIETQIREDNLKPSARHCPECHEAFVLINSAGIELDACLACGSFWLDQGELKVLTHRIADIQTQEGPVAPSRFSCPVCDARMQQHRFLVHNDLLVDKCSAGHGIYLERDELVRSVML
jgi:Zn-finger nucleic acid-binding protein